MPLLTVRHVSVLLVLCSIRSTNCLTTRHSRSSVHHESWCGVGASKMAADSQAHTTIEVGSNRSFGLVFCCVFLAVALFPLLSGAGVRLWALLLAATFLFFSFFFTNLLRPLNLLWFKFGVLLGKIVNPIVMLLLYVLTVVPFGLGFKLAGRDPLRLKSNETSPSYWILREPPGPQPDSLENQF